MAMSEFSETYQFQNIVKGRPYYKNLSKPTCIKLISTNFPKLVQHFQIIETGLSEFHKLVLIVLKIHFSRLKPNIANDKDYQGFINDYFPSELLKEIDGSGSNITNCKEHNVGLQGVPDKHTSLKKGYVRS